MLNPMLAYNGIWDYGHISKGASVLLAYMNAFVYTLILTVLTTVLVTIAAIF